jgi:hypothetical protein
LVPDTVAPTTVLRWVNPRCTISNQDRPVPSENSTRWISALLAALAMV